MRVKTSSQQDTVRLGKRLAKRLTAGSVVALYGELGTGKTTLIKGIVEGVGSGSVDEVVSPTFAYLNIYERGSAVPVYHLDLYRLHSVSEFVSMGLEEYLHSRGICCIEWAQRIAALLPPHALEVHLSHLGEDCREVETRERALHR